MPRPFMSRLRILDRRQVGPNLVPKQRRGSGAWAPTARAALLGTAMSDRGRPRVPRFAVAGSASGAQPANLHEHQSNGNDRKPNTAACAAMRRRASPVATATLAIDLSGYRSSSVTVNTR